MRNHHDAKRADAQNRQASASAASLIVVRRAGCVFAFAGLSSCANRGSPVGSRETAPWGLEGPRGAAQIRLGDSCSRDIRGHATAFNAHTDASTKGRVTPHLTSDVLFASSGAMGHAARWCRLPSHPRKRGASPVPTAYPWRYRSRSPRRTTALLVYACWCHEGGVAALREQPVGAVLCVLRGLARGRGWAAPRRAVSCAVLVVTDRAGGVEGVVGRWQTVDAVGHPDGCWCPGVPFSDRSSWEHSYEDLSIVERAD